MPSSNMPSSTFILLAVLAGAASVSAHGHVTNIVINGQSYSGFLPNKFPYMPSPPVVAGWTATNTDNGFVGPESFGSGDIICHKSATNAKGHAVVAAGDRILIQWDTWPESHHGPVIDYLANCGSGGCESVDKSSLNFFKIDEVGLINGAKAPGTWASDQLIANNKSWLVEIPSNIAPGFYVLRHEIIALHSAGQNNGAQNYPQCFNLQITGSGTATPSGVRGTALYKPNDAGILFNIYGALSSYPIPGPSLISGARSITQGRSAISASATAITDSGAAAPSNPPPPVATTATTQQNGAQPTITGTSVVQTTNKQTTSTKATNTQVTDTLVNTTTPATTNAPAIPPTPTDLAPVTITVTTTVAGNCTQKNGGGGKHKGPRAHARDLRG